MSSRPWIQEEPTGITLTLHIQPGAKRTEVVGLHGGALKLRLAAPPVEGRANEALIAFLADQFGVPRRQVELLSGHSGRAKRVRITAPVLRPDREWGGMVS